MTEREMRGLIAESSRLLTREERLRRNQASATVANPRTARRIARTVSQSRAVGQRMHAHPELLRALLSSESDEKGRDR